MNPRHLLAIAAICAVSTTSTFAAEGAIGRPVSGTLINAFVGVAPSAPGISVWVAKIFYDADIGAKRATPIGANLALGLDGWEFAFWKTACFSP